MNFINEPNFAQGIQGWLNSVHNEVHKECQGWKRYQEVTEAVDELVKSLQEKNFTDAQIDDIYSTIYDNQNLAASVAYLLGVRDGLAVRDTLSNISIPEFLEKNLV